GIKLTTVRKRNRELENQRARELYRSDPARRAKNAADQRAFRAKNPNYYLDWRKRTLEKQRLSSRRSKFKNSYGITYEQRDQMLAEQGGRCAICRTDDPGKQGWCLDHCHVTGRNRGLLCSRCNFALGLLDDDPEHFRTAIKYLLEQK